MRTALGLTRALLTGLSLAATALATPATAQDFYAGKTIRLVAAFPPGASIDRTSRIIAQFLPKYIPGKPLVIVENMAGAGGVVAANYLFNVAPKDGTVIGVFNTILPYLQLMGQEGVAYKANRFNWVGALTDTRLVCYVTADVKDVRSMDDLLKPRSQPVRFGAAGAGDDPTAATNFLRMAEGQVRIIAGYPSIQAIYLAMEQGEVQGSCSPWEGVRVSSAAKIESGALTVFTQDGKVKAADLQKPQLMLESMIKPQYKTLWTALTKAHVAGRPMALSPDVPAARVDILRRAYDAVMKDPELLAAMAKTGDAVNPSTGEQVQALVDDVMLTPPEVVAQLKILYGGK